MPIVRVRKKINYTIIPNGFINDKRLSLKAKGLLLYFLSKPDDWTFYLSEISKNSTDGIQSISSGLKELEECGYIQKNLKRNKGKLSGGYDFYVYETPQLQPKQENTESVKHQIGDLPNRENPVLLNTDTNTNTNNIYIHWNSKNIIKHSSLTKEIEKAIEKSLKIYAENDIKQAIDVYNEIIKSEFYFSYKWSLPDFLNRKNGISTFMDEGSNKANYEEWKRKGGNSGDRSPTRSTIIPSKSFEGNKLEERPIELTEDERRELNELE